MGQSFMCHGVYRSYFVSIADGERHAVGFSNNMQTSSWQLQLSLVSTQSIKIEYCISRFLRHVSYAGSGGMGMHGICIRMDFMSFTLVLLSSYGAIENVQSV